MADWLAEAIATGDLERVPANIGAAGERVAIRRPHVDQLRGEIIRTFLAASSRSPTTVAIAVAGLSRDGLLGTGSGWIGGGCRSSQRSQPRLMQSFSSEADDVRQRMAPRQA